MSKGQEEIRQFLANIRKTISESETLVSQAELRIAETDRMLERQGLTREQVLHMRFSEEQMSAANAELKRRGMDPLEKWSPLPDVEHDIVREAPHVEAKSEEKDAELANRQKKFGMMMKPFQI